MCRQDLADSYRCRPNVKNPAHSEKDHLKAQRAMGRVLLEEGIATAPQLSEALAAAESGGHILQHLVAAGHLTPGDLHEFLSRQPGVAGIDISQYVVERGLAQLIPGDLARERLVMPIDALGKLLTVGMACPVDVATIAEVEALTGRRVKAVLCRTHDLLQAIEKQYPAESETADTSFDGLNLPPSSASLATPPAKTDAVEKLRALDTLPLSSTALQKLDSLWSSDAPSVIDVCDFMCEQPSLTAAALRAANADAFGLNGQVGSPALACSILGAETVRAIALDSGRAGGRFDIERHAQEAVLCARASEKITRTCGHSDTGLMFSAGLLHAIGRLALAQIEPEFYASLQERDRDDWINLEIQRFGLSFAEAGHELLDAWNVPPELSGVIRDQLDPASSEAHREPAAILACARSLALAHLANTPNPALQPQVKHLFEIVGLEPAIADTILAELGRAA